MDNSSVPIVEVFLGTAFFMFLIFGYILCATKLKLSVEKMFVLAILGAVLGAMDFIFVSGTMMSH